MGYNSLEAYKYHYNLDAMKLSLIPAIAMKNYMSICMKECVCVYTRTWTSVGFYECASTCEQCICVHMVHFQPCMHKGMCVCMCEYVRYICTWNMHMDVHIHV